MNYQVLSVFVVALLGAQTVVHGNDDVKCENLTFDICRKLDYNRTIFPNYFGHRKQSEAALVVNALDRLMRSGCSPDLLTFVCSVYFPMCTSIDKLIPPCRSLCLDVKNGCEAKLKKLYGLDWHKDLQCGQFPTLDKALCVFQNKTAARPTLPTLIINRTTRKSKKIKKVTVISRKLTQKHCPVNKGVKKSKTECCKCCQRGNRAARANISTCALRRSYIKREKSIEKTLKECTTRTSKRCYTNCCAAKRSEVRKTKTTRRQRTRRSRNRNRRKSRLG